MKSHFLKENDVVLSSRWQFQDGRRKGMGTEWDQEVVGNVDPQKKKKKPKLDFSHCRSGSDFVSPGRAWIRMMFF